MSGAGDGRGASAVGEYAEKFPPDAARNNCWGDQRDWYGEWNWL